MSIDFEDPQLDALLERHARSWQASFAAPPLGGMLAVATSQDDRHRWRWLLPVAAAALLLIVPLITVLPAHRHKHAQPATPTPSVPVTERVLGTLPWSSAVLQADGKTLTVEASPKAACGERVPSARASVVSQTPKAVRVRVTSYVRSDAALVPPAPGFACNVSPMATFPVTATVPVALNGRQLVDDETGDQQAVLDVRTVNITGFVPKGFVDDGIGWTQGSLGHPPTVRHSFHNKTGELTIIRQASSDPGDDPVIGVDAGPIHGHTGNYSALLGELSWRQGDYVWTISQTAYNGTGKVQVKLSTLLKMANSLP